MKATLIFLFVLIATASYGQLSIQELIQKSKDVPPNGGAVGNYISQEEQTRLRQHFINLNTTQLVNQFDGLLYSTNTSNLSYGYIDILEPDTHVPIGPSLSTTDFEGAGDVDNFDTEDAYVLTYENGEFYKVNLQTGIYTFLGTIAPPPGHFWTGLELGLLNDGCLFVISTNFAGNSTLGTIDLGDLTYTERGSNTMPGAIAISSTDFSSTTLYSYDVVDDNFYTIDMIDGTATLIGPIGFDANFGQDLEWDNQSQMMYMTAYNQDVADAELREVDINTGMTTLIAQILPTENSQISWAGAKNTQILIGVEDKVIHDIAISPNPAKDIIQFSGALNIKKVDVYSLSGQLVLTTSEILNNQISAAALSPGSYIICIESEIGLKSLPFLKN